MNSSKEFLFYSRTKCSSTTVFLHTLVLRDYLAHITDQNFTDILYGTVMSVEHLDA